MVRTPVWAAGGIVVRRGDVPLIAVVRLSKRNDWVLPKGKLNSGETARAAAKREVMEETGHGVSVHEFLGTLAYDSGDRLKVVNFWRMQASAQPTRDLMGDVKAVAWLPLDEAVERLSRAYEQAFLANIGPRALELAAAASRNGGAARRPAVRRPTSNPTRGRPPVPLPEHVPPALPIPPQQDPETRAGDVPCVAGDIAEPVINLAASDGAANAGSLTPPAAEQELVEAGDATPTAVNVAFLEGAACTSPVRPENLLASAWVWLRWRIAGARSVASDASLRPPAASILRPRS